MGKTTGCASEKCVSVVEWAVSILTIHPLSVHVPVLIGWPSPENVGTAFSPRLLEFIVIESNNCICILCYKSYPVQAISTIKERANFGGQTKSRLSYSLKKPCLSMCNITIMSELTDRWKRNFKFLWKNSFCVGSKFFFSYQEI